MARRHRWSCRILTEYLTFPTWWNSSNKIKKELKNSSSTVYFRNQPFLCHFTLLNLTMGGRIDLLPTHMVFPFSYHGISAIFIRWRLIACVTTSSVPLSLFFNHRILFVGISLHNIRFDNLSELCLNWAWTGVIKYFIGNVSVNCENMIIVLCWRETDHWYPQSWNCRNIMTDYLSFLNL